MNVGIRRVGVAVVALLLLLVGQLTYLQVVDAKELAHDSRNPRDRLRDERAPRGKIISADNKVLARSVPSADTYQRQRVYPLGALTSQVVGYQSLVVGTAGLEREYNDVLTGRGRAKIDLRDVVDFLRGTKRVGNLTTSLRVDAQLVAKDALGDQKGSVVVIEPATGSIVAMYSNPSYDPTPLAGHNRQHVQENFNLLSADPANPALPRAYREIYPPGSTFKVVTVTDGLETGKATLDTTFPTLRELALPQSTNTIANFGRSSCGGDLTYVFVHSCNTAFAQIGLDLGNLFPPLMARFGVGDTPPLDLDPGAVASQGPAPNTFDQNKPRFALAGIGQGDVFTTPLQMAMVAAAIANGGVVMEPHLGTAVLDDEGKLLTRIQPKEWRRATTPEVAAQVRDLMVQVVNSRGGTGTAGAIAGISVAGKTGTAQTVEGESPHAWFVAFAPAEAPRYAVAVIVEHGGNAGSEATGGRVAAPIARKMLEFLLTGS
jgi:peptidoglycan glycosyltransferase